MLFHDDFHIPVIEFYIHAQKTVLVSSRLRHLPKNFFNRFDYLIDHLWIHMTDLVVIHVPAHCALFPLSVCICYSHIVWVIFKTHVLQGGLI